MRNRAFLPIYKLKIADTLFTLFFSLPYNWKTGDLAFADHTHVLDFELVTHKVKEQVQQCLGQPPVFCSCWVSKANQGVASLWHDSIILIGWPWLLIVQSTSSYWDLTITSTKFLSAWVSHLWFLLLANKRFSDVWWWPVYPGRYHIFLSGAEGRKVPWASIWTWGKRPKKEEFKPVLFML